MITKLFEVRDRATFIPVVAVRLGSSDFEAERYLASRAGFGRAYEQQAQYVLMGKIDGGCGQMTCDVYDWGGSRTMQVAHQHIINNFE